MLSEDVPEHYRHRQPRFVEAKVLVSVGRDHHGRDALLAPQAAIAWSRMVAAATTDGITLLLISAFRSVARQTEIVTRKRARGFSWDEILGSSAYPGFSEHHTGCAVDVASPKCPTLIEEFEHTPEFAWLTDNALQFGFRMSYPRDNPLGVIFEPWHWMWKSEAPALPS